MPTFLKDGSDHYNRMRRIHPRDAISKLDYYLPATTNQSSPMSSLSSSSSSSASTANSSRQIGSSSNSSNHIVWPPPTAQQSTCIRKRRVPASQIGSGSPATASDSSREKAAESPFQTSGFSDGTVIAERTISEEFEIPNGIIGLQDRNCYLLEGQQQTVAAHHLGGRRKSRLNVSIDDYIKRSAVSRSGGGGADMVAVGKLSPMQHHFLHQHHDPSQLLPPPLHTNARLKRRNIKRFNRRMMAPHAAMMMDNDFQEDEYALSELFSQSEIPGFREIFASDSYLRKFCWVVAFLVMTVLSLNDMTSLITEYLEYPITVNVRLKDSARLPFPAVTVCNLNVVRSSALCTPSSQFDLAKMMPSELREKLCAFPVDKKANNSGDMGDSDMADINNIGLTTTTTTTTTTTAAPPTMPADETTPTNEPGPNTTPNEQPPGGGDSAATATNNQSTTGNPNNPDAADDDDNESSLARPSPGGSTGKGKPGSPRGSSSSSLEPKDSASTTTSTSTATTAPPTTSTPSGKQTTRLTNNGGLDLGSDYYRRRVQQNAGRKRVGVNANEKASLIGGGRVGSRTSRSIKLADLQQHPFSSGASRIRIPAPGQQQQQQDLKGYNKRPTTATAINAANVMRTNQAANHLTAAGVQLQSSHGIGRPPGANPNGGGGPNSQSVTMNSYPNSMGSTLAPPPSAASATTSQPTGGGGGGGFQIGNSAGPSQPEDFELTERQERELQENLTNWLAVMYNRDPTLTRMLGHQFDDMILRCTMKSVNCTHQRSFEHSFSPTEGNCFTYRSKIRRRPQPALALSSTGSRGGTSFDDAHLAGTNQGLELVLNLEKNEYISGSSQVGALVMIHHPSDLGYAASEATFVAPEFTTYIGLKMVNLTRLPWPHPEMCVDSWPGKFADTLTRNSTYSQQACLKICLQKTIQSHCQCQSATLPIVELESNQFKAPSASAAAAAGNSTNDQQSQPQRIIICDTRKQATRQCVNNVMLRAADKVHNCDCPPKCQVVRYDKTISMAKWPTKEDKVSFDRGKLDVNFQNLAKVIVYFQTMTCDEITQEGMQTPAKLFSSVGGIMGMYVGFSFLSVFEIVEVMSRKMWHHLMVRLARRSSRSLGAGGQFRA